MSFYDDMRDLTAELDREFGVPATITTKGSRTQNPISGDVTTTGSSVTPCLATLGKRDLRADDGTIVVQAIAGLNVSAEAGDTLKIGTLEFTVGDVEEDNPEGTTPMGWTVVLS